MRRRAAVVVAMALLVTAAPRAGATEGARTVRLAGTTRITTAIEVSKDRFGADAAGAVVLARSDTYPDALSGGPLAVAENGPLLLTNPASLDGATRAEIDRVLAPGATVYLLGGTGALSPTVESQVADLGYTVVRYGGANRFETAVIVNRDGLGDPSSLFVADGMTFTYPLIAAAAAPAADGGVVLTNGGALPPETAAYLEASGGEETYAVGANAAAAVPSADRLAGGDQYVTAQIVADRFFPDPLRAAVANGTNFPDALSGGAHIAALGGPLLFVTASTLPAATADYLTQNRSTIAVAYVYGGTGVISSEVESGIADAIDTSVAFGDGTHRVGQDIPAGTYRTRADASGCYWERLSGFSGEFDDIEANEFTNFHTVVTVSASDAGFKSDGCGTWTSNLSAITSSPTAPFGSGTWIVGTDIAAGTWRAPGGDGCYWERLSGFSGTFDDLVTNDFGPTSPTVTIESGDAGFKSDDCGTWSKVS
jgi:hypothetical protein